MSAIWWIRRDLRLQDNQALAAAYDYASQASEPGTVLPVFILDENLLKSPYNSQKRQAFLFSGLRSLDECLRSIGSRLLIRRGNPGLVLRELLLEVNAQHIFAEADWTPYARQRDEWIKTHLPATFTPGLTARPPDTVHKSDGKPYTVFTPFSNAWKSLPELTREQLSVAPQRLATPPNISGIDLPLITGADNLPFVAGEPEAQRRLQSFSLGGSAPVYQYRQQRDLPDLHGTSGLSPYLRFGMLSARQAVLAAHAAIASAPDEAGKTSAETWLNEILWREFFQVILYHFPRVRRESFQPDLSKIRWSNDLEDFQAWQNGQTGYPLVDAGMRQLSSTGWMHNRVRMIVASFLTKDLLIDWRWGELWFMQHLIDGDPAANNGGWQWTAGTGTDAAPYFRIFNPIAQSQRFDPHGSYIRRWLPELALVPDEYIHTPWEMPVSLQKQTNCQIGLDYPAPIIAHDFARQRTLSAYKSVRGVTANQGK